MKVVLRFGALAVGIALTANGVGEAATSKAQAPSAVQGAPEEKRRNGPARVSPASAKFAELPRIADSKKDALADKKRDEAIDAFKRLIAKVQNPTSKADLLYRLSELYWEKSKYLYRLEMDRYLEAEKQHDAAVARGDKVEPPKEDHRESERYRAETMSLYEDILRDHPQYKRRDEVLFSQGYNLYELGRGPEAVKRYEELIRDFPKSEFVPDAYIQLGNYYFDNNKLIPAKQNYERARDTGVPKIYAYAIYKLAWCDYNSGDYEAGLKKLQETVQYAETRGEELGDLKTEALNDLTVFYVQLDQPKEAIAYFKEKAPAKRQARLMAKTAVGLADAGHFDSAIHVFRWLIDDKPMGPSAPEYQQAIVRAHEGLRQRTQVRAEMKRMVDLYRPGGSWWRANADNKPVLRNAFNVTEEALRVMVTEYHQEAQKTREVATYQLARDIYKEYVDAFASSEDPDFVSDSAFNLRFFYAEILWALEEWEAAATQYDAVVAFKIPDREPAREVSNESYRKSASFAAVLAYDKLVKIERGQLAKSGLRAGQKVDENKYKGDVEKKRIIKKDAKEQQEQALTRFEERLVAACDTYNTLYPGNPDEVDLRYQAAVILYDRNHFVDAARRFGEIIAKFPEERRSRDAADLAMFVLESREEWLELNKLSRQFQAHKKLTKPGTDFAARVAKVVEGSQYKWVDEIVYRQEKNPKKAAELFLEFVTEFPKSENADRALTYAMIIFQEAAELDRGVEAGERALREYPDSVFSLKVRYTLAGLYEKMAEFKKAAEAYEAFVEAYDAAAGTKKRRVSKVAQRSGEREQLVREAEAWVADALFNAGLWWEGMGASHKAIAAYSAYISRFKDRKDVPRIAFNIALVHEKEGRWADAAKAFASFAETYTRDSRTSPGQLYLAKYRELMAYRQLKDARDSERLQGELVRGWARLSDEDKKDVRLLDAYAHARFLELEPVWKRYTDIRFSRVSTLRRDLASKQREIQKVEKEYAAVLGIGSGEWGIAALTRIGMAYADFARNIIESPDPKGLDEEQLAMYRGELENLALPLEDKANEALEKALAKAYELAVYNEWTLAAQDQVNRYHPGAYAQVRQVPFRGSELFTTSDVAKDPGTPTAAISLYEQALKAPGHEHDVALLNNLALAYRLAGRFEQAEATARRVLARSKDNPEAYKNLALIYYDQGQYRLAEVVSANARKLAENDPDVYNNLGMIYLKLNDRPRALAQFQKAVSLDAKFTPGYLNIGAMALSYRDYVGAERAFARMVELDPTSYEGYLYYAYALDGQKGRDPKRGLAAGEAFEKVLTLRPDQPEAVCGAGWAYAAERAGWDKALGFFERCKALASTTPQDRQMIEAKVQGIQAMKKNGQPKPAEPKKEAPPAPSGEGSLLDKVSEDAARQEGTPPEEAAPAGSDGTMYRAL